MSRTSFTVNLHSIVCLNVKELLARSRCHIWSLSDNNGIRIRNHLECRFHSETRMWQVHRTDKYSQHSNIYIFNCHVRISAWNIQFEARCCHLNVKYDACFEQGVVVYIVVVSNLRKLFTVLPNFISGECCFRSFQPCEDFI